MKLQAIEMQMTGDRTFVLEIGSEELPPQDVSSAIGQVCKGVKASYYYRLP